MIYCQNCRKENDYGTNFCRFCGNPFTQVQTQQNSEYNQPRPYMWKTDEYQVRKDSARKTQDFNNPQSVFQTKTLPTQNQGMVYQQPAFVAEGYRCPRCGTHTPPYVKRQISTAGWVTFAVLLVTTFIFFWIGLLLKEDVKICPVCNCQVS